MPKRHETVNMDAKDLQEAIQDWLFKKYGPKSSTSSDWSISLKHSRSTSGQGYAEVDTDHFSATATRNVD